MVNFCCCTINVVLSETLVSGPKNIDLYTVGGGLKKYTVCTLVKILTIMDGPLDMLLIPEIKHDCLQVRVIHSSFSLQSNNQTQTIKLVIIVK